jgi:hypothetical protein
LQIGIADGWDVEYDALAELQRAKSRGASKLGVHPGA